MPDHRSRLVHLSILSLIAAMVGGPPAWATVENLKTFKTAYPASKASCKMCHQNVMGRKGDLNSYGLALQQRHTPPADAKQLTVDELRAIEHDDSDGDGASNLDEINAGTAPGDPASVPQQAANTNQGGGK